MKYLKKVKKNTKMKKQQIGNSVIRLLVKIFFSKDLLLFLKTNLFQGYRVPPGTGQIFPLVSGVLEKSHRSLSEWTSDTRSDTGSDTG